MKTISRVGYPSYSLVLFDIPTINQGCNIVAELSNMLSDIGPAFLQIKLIVVTSLDCVIQ